MHDVGAALGDIGGPIGTGISGISTDIITGFGDLKNIVDNQSEKGE